MKGLWLAMVALLAGFIAWRWFYPPEPPGVEKLPLFESEEKALDNVLDSMDKVSAFPPMGAYESIGQRPLFFAQRRPPPPYVPLPSRSKPVNKASRKTPKPRVHLSAVIIIGNQKTALLTGGRKKGARRVKVGEDVDGWTVDSITADKIVLSNGGETLELLLRNYKPVLPSRNAKKAKNNKTDKKGSSGGRQKNAVPQKEPPKR